MRLKYWAWILLLCVLLWTGLGLVQEVEPLPTLIGHTSYMCSVTFCSKARPVASGSGDATIELWNVATMNDTKKELE